MHTWLLTTGDRGPFRSLRNSSVKLSALKEYIYISPDGTIQNPLNIHTHTHIYIYIYMSGFLTNSCTSSVDKFVSRADLVGCSRNKFVDGRTTRVGRKTTHILPLPACRALSQHACPTDNHYIYIYIYIYICRQRVVSTFEVSSVQLVK